MLDVIAGGRSLGNHHARLQESTQRRVGQACKSITRRQAGLHANVVVSRVLPVELGQESNVVPILGQEGNAVALSGLVSYREPNRRMKSQFRLPLRHNTYLAHADVVVGGLQPSHAGGTRVNGPEHNLGVDVLAQASVEV